MNYEALLSAEILFAVGSFTFNIYALPTLLNSDSAVPRLQSIPSVFTLIVFFTIPYLSIGYVISAASTSIGAVLWTLIAIYRAPPNTTHDTSHSTVQTQPAD